MFVGVIRARAGLVAAAEADQVRREYAMALGRQGGDDVAIQIAPAWLTMQKQSRRGAGGPFINVMHSQFGAVDMPYRRVVGRETVVGKVVESVIGRAQHIHGVISPADLLFMARCVPLSSRSVKPRSIRRGWRRCRKAN